MFDVFIKFSDYSLIVRALVASWIIFTALICIVALIAKPIKKETSETRPIQPGQEKIIPPIMATDKTISRPNVGFRVEDSTDTVFIDCEARGHDIGFDVNKNSKKTTFINSKSIDLTPNAKKKK